MKKILAVTLTTLACLSVNAQGGGQLDSLKYILPEFTRGTVIFADKTVKSGILNISPMDQAVYCLSEKNDTLYVAGHPDILSVSVSGKSFIGWKGAFVEILTRNSDIGIGFTRTTLKVNNVRTGAYGRASATSATKSYSVDASSGTMHNVIIDDPRNFVYIKTAYLLNGEKFLPTSKKSFQKLFPAQKDFIESVWSERDINASDIDAVIAFYDELRRK